MHVKIPFRVTITAKPVAAAPIAAPCEPVSRPVVATPQMAAPPPCKPVTPTCPPCKPDAPTCQPCEPAVPTCPPPKQKPPVVAALPPVKPAPCVPQAATKPVEVIDEHAHDINHPSKATETWHHHHHGHAAPTVTAQPAVAATPAVVATPAAALVPHATTPLVHVDGNAAFPVDTKPAVAPVVVNPAQRPPPVEGHVPVAVAPPAAPAAGTCCNEGISGC